jgi:MFS transporter
VPALVGKPGLITANPILEGASTAASVIGPSLGGVLAAGIGAASTRSVDAASFAASAALLAAITRPLQADRDGRHHHRRLSARLLTEEVTQGLSFLAREPVVRILVVISTALSIAGGTVFGLLVVYATKGLGQSPHSALIGAFYTAAGIGGVGSALYASVLGRRLGPTRAALVSLGFTPAALVVVAAWVAAYSGVTINAITARQFRIPDHLQGRVNTSARIIAWGLGWLIGAGLGGLLAGPLGIRQTYLAFAFGLTLLTALAWLSPLRSVADKST